MTEEQEKQVADDLMDENLQYCLPGFRNYHWAGREGKIRGFSGYSMSQAMEIMKQSRRVIANIEAAKLPEVDEVCRKADDAARAIIAKVMEANQ